MTGFKSKREAAQAGSVTKDEALKLALEALGAYMSATDSEEDAKAHSLMAEAFFKIKEALAQDEQSIVRMPTSADVAEAMQMQGFAYLQHHAPERTWVGLTWDDVPEADVGNQDFRRGAMWAVDFLKERS